MRNIAQPCAICQQNLLFALDKESLTARLRVAIAFRRNAKRVDRKQIPRHAPIQKLKIQYDDQSVMRDANLARGTARTHARMKSQMQTK